MTKFEDQPNMSIDGSHTTNLSNLLQSVSKTLISTARYTVIDPNVEPLSADHSRSHILYEGEGHFLNEMSKDHNVEDKTKDYNLSRLILYQPTESKRSYLLFSQC